MRRLITVATVALVLALSGCGGSSTPPTPVPTGLTIVAPDGVLFLGQTYSFVARIQLSNGSSNTVTGTWGSDAPSVATAQAATGQVQVVGLGEATIFVDAQGLRATRRIRSTVNYQGRLDGASRMTSCSQTGIFKTADICGEVPTGAVFAFIGVFTQNGESVVATMDLGEEVGEFPAEPTSVTINSAGELRFTSEHRVDDLAATAQWVLRPSGLTRIGGTLIVRVRVVGQSGTWETRGEVLPTSIARTLVEEGPAGAPSLREILRRLPR